MCIFSLDESVCFLFKEKSPDDPFCLLLGKLASQRGEVMAKDA